MDFPHTLFLSVIKTPFEPLGVFHLLEPILLEQGVARVLELGDGDRRPHLNRGAQDGGRRGASTSRRGPKHSAAEGGGEWDGIN